MLFEDGEVARTIRLALLRTRHNALAEVEKFIMGKEDISVEEIKKFLAGWKSSLRFTMSEVEKEKT